MDLETVITKAREARTALLITGEGAELEAKRFIEIQEFADVLDVYRELVIQGQSGAFVRVTEYLKAKAFRDFRNALTAYRKEEGVGTSSAELAERIVLREQLVSYLEDLILSASPGL